MKPLCTVLALFLLLVPVYTATASFGIGIILGEPTGISMKVGDSLAFAVAWSFDNFLHLHGDYWFMHNHLAGPVDWYLGGGLKLQLHSRANSNTRLGVRIPAGVQWFFAPKFELFAELVPGMRFIPETRFEINGGIGLRYHF